MPPPPTTEPEWASSRLAARLRFRHLQILVALHEAGSLSAAAQRLHLTQPALSKAVGEIESAFGRALYARTARGLVPTAAGRVLIQGAGLLLHELAHVQKEVDASEHATAILRIGTTSFMAQSYLPAALRALGEGPSPVIAHIVEDRAPSLLQALAAGELDAAITTYPARQEQLDDFRYSTLLEVGFSVIAAPSHRLAGAGRVGWAALAAERWIMPAPSAMIRHALHACFRRADTLPPVPAIEAANPATCIELVAAGLGLSIVPAVSARRAVDAGTVKPLHVAPAFPRHPVALIYAEPLQNPRVLRLRDALQRLILASREDG